MCQQVDVPHHGVPRALQVQFKDKLVVYHIPGKKEGLDVAGMTGTVVQDVTMYKGVELSPNFPFKIQLETEVKGKAKKFFVHVVRLPTGHPPAWRSESACTCLQTLPAHRTAAPVCSICCGSTACRSTSHQAAHAEFPVRLQATAEHVLAVAPLGMHKS